MPHGGPLQIWVRFPGAVKHLFKSPTFALVVKVADPIVLMSGPSRAFPQPFEPYENQGRWPNAGNPAYTAGGHAPPQQSEFSVLHDAVDWTLRPEHF